jgi:hypothetical protein
MCELKLEVLNVFDPRMFREMFQSRYDIFVSCLIESILMRLKHFKLFHETFTASFHLKWWLSRIVIFTKLRVDRLSLLSFCSAVGQERLSSTKTVLTAGSYRARYKISRPTCGARVQASNRTSFRYRRLALSRHAGMQQASSTVGR